MLFAISDKKPSFIYGKLPRRWLHLHLSKTNRSILTDSKLVGLITIPGSGQKNSLKLLESPLPSPSPGTVALRIAKKPNASFTNHSPSIEPTRSGSFSMSLSMKQWKQAAKPLSNPGKD